MDRVMPPPLDAAVIRQAAEWLVELQSDTVTPGVRRAWTQWRRAHPDHEAAWQRVQALADKLRNVPQPLAHAALAPAGRRSSRRHTIKVLSLLAMAGGGGLLAVRQAPQWTADHRTRVGQRDQVTLPDGTRVDLNTDSAIDVRFSAAQRRVVMVRGEILVTTARDPASPARPFLVETHVGMLRALGTRFSVGLSEGDCDIQVFEGAVEVRAATGNPYVVRAGERVRLGAAGVTAAGAAQPRGLGWTHGMLLANDMPLGLFLSELGRHRPGYLGCDPSVARLKVSGSFPLADTDRVLSVLQADLPIDVQRFTSYWTRVRPASA
jgi:transmembrane sensor